MVEVELDHFFLARHQLALLLQRPDDLQQPLQVVKAGLAQHDQRRIGYHRAAAGMGEQLLEQRTVNTLADEVAALDTQPGGLDGRGKAQAELAWQVIGRGFQPCLTFFRRKLAQQLAAGTVDAGGGVHQIHQLVGLERGGGMCGHFFHAQAETFARGGVADRRQQHQLAGSQPLGDGLGIDPAHRAGILHVHAVEHTHRTCHQIVAASHAQVGAGHGRIGQGHRQLGFDFGPRIADAVLDGIHGRGIGNAAAAVVLACLAAQGQQRFHLRAGTVHQHDADA